MEKRLAELVLPDLGVPLSECGKIRLSEAAGTVAMEVTFSIPCGWLKGWLQGEVER